MTLQLDVRRSLRPCFQKLLEGCNDCDLVATFGVYKGPPWQCLNEKASLEILLQLSTTRCPSTGQQQELPNSSRVAGFQHAQYIPGES